MNTFNTPEELINYLDHNTESLHSVYTGERGAFALHKYIDIHKLNKVIFSGEHTYAYGKFTAPIQTNATLTVDPNADSRDIKSDFHDHGGIVESYKYYIISRPLKKKNP